MTTAQVGNEALLLLIGAGIGTLLNLYMPGKEKEIRMTQYWLEEDLRAVLLRMSEYIGKEDRSDYTESCFDKLQTDIAAGKKQAFAYMNNTFFCSRHILFQHIMRGKYRIGGNCTSQTERITTGDKKEQENAVFSRNRNILLTI